MRHLVDVRVAFFDGFQESRHEVSLPELPGLLAQAETAARAADRYAIGGRPPDRYLVYYAGKGEWQRWYGGGRPTCGWTS